MLGRRPLPVLAFLRTRSARLDKKGIVSCEPLIPACHSRKPNYYAASALRILKKEVEMRSGIQFRWKDLRASYAQMLIDRKARIETVSKALGHQTTKTTEIWYARIKDTSVHEEINALWDTGNEKESEPARIKPKIDYISGITGYN